MRRTKKDRLSYSAGEKGRNRVRVFEDPKTGMMQLEWRESGQRIQKTLKHRDGDKAKKQADQFAGEYSAPKADAESEPLTLGKLFEIYLGEVTPNKSKAVQKFDKAAAKRLEACLRSERTVSQLSRREWDLFIRERTSGKITGRSVGPRTVTRDLKFLLATINWATVSGDGRGGVLLSRNPLKGRSFPPQQHTRSPTLAEAEYDSLLAIAH